MRVIDEDLTQLDTMLNERLLADGTYEELEVIDIPGQINIKDDVANQAEMENYKSAGAGVTETDGMLSIPANETVSYQLQVTKGGKYLLKFAYTNNGEAVKLNDVLDVFVGVGQVGIDDSVVLESGSGLETVAFQVGIPTGDISFDLTSKSDADIQWDSFTLERDNSADVSTTSPPAASARWRAKTMWTLPPACAMRTSRTTARPARQMPVQHARRFPCEL